MSDKIKLMHPDVGDRELALVEEVIRSGNLVEGAMVREFEKTVAEYLGVKHTVACTSATTGLELALRALGVGGGDEVIVPDFTHPATALAVKTVGAEPVLVDVDPVSFNATAALIEEAVTPKTRAVIPVSIFGNPLDLDPVMVLGEKYRIAVVEDAACSLGSQYRDRKVGSIAHMSVFSFHPRKVFTTGDGGLIATDNGQYAELMTSMKKFGTVILDGKATFTRWGTNYRMSDILGAVALAQVRRIDEIVGDRIEKAAVYDGLLEGIGEIERPRVEKDCRSNYQTYCITVKNGKRDTLLAEMRERNIEVQIGTYALHKLPVFKDLKRVGSLEHSLFLYENLLALPLHHRLTGADQARVVETLRELL